MNDRLSVVHVCGSWVSTQRCDCKKIISREEACALVRDGEAEWLCDSELVPTWNIVTIAVKPKTPRATVSGKAHIERSVVNKNREDRARIAEEERLARRFYKELIKPFYDPWAIPPVSRTRYVKCVHGMVSETCSFCLDKK